MNSVEQFFTGIFGLFVIALAITLIIYWIAFPILVMRYLREMLKSQREVAEHLKVLRSEYEAQLIPPLL